ncbi:MAG: CoA transferase, partial [Desulfobacteraceae bacterium]|nr:CoA transferase [Desulfobacteraceae bacterium]
DAINQLLIEWTTQHTKEEIFRKGQALSCPVSPSKSAEDLMNSEQLKDRGFFAETTHPFLGALKMPTSASRFSESPWRFERPAPLLGESNEEVYGKGLGYKKEELARLKTKGVI